MELTTDLFVLALLVLLGHAIHLLKKTVDLRTEVDVTIIDLVKGRPYRTALGVCGSVAGAFVLWEMGQLTAVSALGIGYMADSGLSLLRQSTEGRAR